MVPAAQEYSKCGFSYHCELQWTSQQAEKDKQALRNYSDDIMLQLIKSKELEPRQITKPNFKKSE